MGVKILNLLPVTADVLTSERFDYMCRYLEPDTLVETYQITQGPPTIECEYDEALAAPYVLELCQKAKAEGFQAIFINCFGDPGVKAAPVFGGFEPATHFALGLADKIGIVTVVPNVVPLIEGNIAKARLEGRVTGVRNVNIPVEELKDHEKMCQALERECLASVREDGSQAIVMGCTGFVEVAERIKAKLLSEGFDVPVLEAAQSALKLCEVYAKLGLRPSRLTYMTPPVR